MNRRLRLSTAMLAILVGGAGCTAGFDTDQGGNAIASGSLINNAYPSWGVTFGCFNGLQAVTNNCTGNPNNNVPAGNAYAVNAESYGVPPHSSPNVFSLDGTRVLFNEQVGFGQANFYSGPQQEVSIWVYPVQLPKGFGPFQNYAYLQAFDSSGHFLGQGTFTPDQSQLNSWHQVVFTSGSQNIAYVAFSTSFGRGYPIASQYDDLCFSPNAGQCASSSAGPARVARQ